MGLLSFLTCCNSDTAQKETQQQAPSQNTIQHNRTSSLNQDNCLGQVLQDNQMLQSGRRAQMQVQIHTSNNNTSNCIESLLLQQKQQQQLQSNQLPAQHSLSQNQVSVPLTAISAQQMQQPCQPSGSFQVLPQATANMVIGGLGQQNQEIACLNNKRRDSRSVSVAQISQQQQPHQIITISNQPPASYQLYPQEAVMTANVPALNMSRQMYPAPAQAQPQLQQMNTGQSAQFQIQQQPSQTISVQPQPQNHFLGPQNQYTQAVNISNINQNQPLDPQGLSGALLNGVDSNRIVQIHVSNQQPQHIMYATGSQNPLPSGFPIQHTQTIQVPATHLPHSHHLHQQYINGQVMNSGPTQNNNLQQNQSQTNLVNIVSQHQLMFVNSASQLGPIPSYPNQVTLNQPHILNQMPTPPQIQYIEFNQPTQQAQQQPALNQPLAQFNITTGYGQAVTNQPMSYSQSIYQPQPQQTTSSQQQQQQIANSYIPQPQFHQNQQAPIQSQVPQQQYLQPGQAYSFSSQSLMHSQQPVQVHHQISPQQQQNINFQRSSGHHLQSFNPHQISASPHSQPVMIPAPGHQFQHQHLTLEQQQLLLQPQSSYSQPVSQSQQQQAVQNNQSQPPSLQNNQSQQSNRNDQAVPVQQSLQIRQQNSAGQRRPPNILTQPLSAQPNSCSQGFDMSPNQAHPGPNFSSTQDQQKTASKFYNPRQQYSQQRSNTINHQKPSQMNEHSSGNSNNRKMHESNIKSEKALLEQHLNQANSVPQGVLLHINYQGNGAGQGTAGFNSGGQGVMHSGNNSSLNDVSLAGSFGNQAHYKPNNGIGIFQQVQSITNQMISSPPMKQASNIEKYLEEQKKVEGLLEMDDIQQRESLQKAQGLMVHCNQPFSLNNSQQQEFSIQIQRPLLQANPCPQELSGYFQNDKAGVSVSSVSQSEQNKLINGDASQSRVKEDLSSQLLTPKKLSHTVNHPGTKKRKSRAAQNMQQELEVLAQQIHQEEEQKHQQNSKSLPQQPLSNLNQQFQAMTIHHRSADDKAQNLMAFNQNLNISGGQSNSQNNGSSGQDQKGAVRSVSKECSNLEDLPFQQNTLINGMNAQISQQIAHQSINQNMINQMQAPLSLQLQQIQQQAQQQYQQEQRVWMLNQEISKTAHLRMDQAQASLQNQEHADLQRNSQQPNKPNLPQVPSDEYEGIKYDRTHNLNSKSFTCTQQFQSPTLNHKDTKQRVYLVKNNLKNNLF